MTSTKFSILLSILISLFFTQRIYAQPQEYLTRFQAYVGGSFDPYTIKDPGGKINDTPIGSISGGLEIDVEYSDVYSAGGGLIYKTYAEGVDFVGGNYATTSPTMETLQIPIHLRARTYFSKGKSTAYIMGGGAWVFNLDYETGNSTAVSSSNSNGDRIDYFLTVDNSLKKSFPLAMAGAGVDFPIFSQLLNSELKHLRFGFSARRFFGFSDVMKIDIDYTINNGNTISATEIYKGGHWMFNIHFMVTI